MKVPVQVEIGGKKVRIKYVDDLEDGEGVQISGDTDTDALVVRINKSKHADERQTFSTLCHELLHCALAVAGISRGWKIEQEEQVVYAIENMLADLLAFNPEAKIRWRNVKWPAAEGEE